MKSGPNKVIKKGIYVLPNLLTAFNLICGILAIVLSLETLSGKLDAAADRPLYMASAWLILTAMIFDYLDGKVARWTHTVSDFGVKIDSLTDFLSFGVAPVVLVYVALLQNVPLYLQVAPCGLFLFAGAWRLARFNHASATSSNHSFFTGLPIPAAASVLCSLVLMSASPEGLVPKVLGVTFQPFPAATGSLLTALLLTALALLMVSHIPFPAFKKINQSNLILLVGVGIFSAVLLLVLPLQNIVFLIMLLYLLIGLFQYFVDQVLKLQNRDW